MKKAECKKMTKLQRYMLYLMLAAIPFCVYLCAATTEADKQAEVWAKEYVEGIKLRSHWNKISVVSAREGNYSFIIWYNLIPSTLMVKWDTIQVVRAVLMKLILNKQQASNLNIHVSAMAEGQGETRRAIIDLGESSYFGDTDTVQFKLPRP